MTIESHPTLHFAVILACYTIGQAAGILAVGYIASKSTLNSIASIRQYIAARWIPVMLRWLMCLFAFFVVWENPSVFPLERFMPSFLAHIGVAGFLGFGSDQVFDKFLALLFPGLQRELPAIPGGDKP